MIHTSMITHRIRPKFLTPAALAVALGLLSLSTGALFSTNASAEEDAENGRNKSNTCMGCHGAPGIRNAYPSFNVPMLAGQQAEYIVAALKAYKDETRSHPTMRAQAASLSDKDIVDISAYFSNFGK